MATASETVPVAARALPWLGALLLSVAAEAQGASEPDSAVAAMQGVTVLDELRHTDPFVRRNAIARIGFDLTVATRFGSREAVPALLEIFASDPDPVCAEAAAEALAHAGAWPLGVFDHVRAHLAAWRTAGAPARAIEALQAAFANAARTWPGAPMAEPLAELLRVPGCAREALGALLVLGPDALPVADAIAALAADEDAELRWRAVAALAVVRPESEAEIRKRGEDRSPAIRRAAFRALCDDARRAGRIEPSVFEFLGLPRRVPPPVADGDLVASLVENLGRRAERDQAIERLRQLGPRAIAAADALAAIAGEDLPLPESEPFGSSKFPDLGPPVSRRLALSALVTIAPERAVKAATAVLDGHTEESRAVELAEVLRALDRRALAPFVMRVAELLRAREDEEACKVGFAVAVALGESALALMPDLLAHLESGDDKMTWRSAEAIASIGPSVGGAAMPVFVAQWARADESLRLVLLRACTRFGQEAEALVQLGLDDGSTQVRLLALGCLPCVPQPSRKTVERAEKLFVEFLDAERAKWVTSDDRFWWAMSAAARSSALRVLGKERAVTMLADGDPRRAAVALEVLWPPSERRIEGWPFAPNYDAWRMLVDEWRQRCRPEEQARAFGSAVSKRAWLLECTKPSFEARDRATATALLGRFEPSTASIARLRELAVDEDSRVRAAALFALGAAGEAGREAIADVAKGLEDDVFRVRASAVLSLQRMYGR